MIKVIFLALLVICSVSQDICQNTHLDYFSEYSLGRQDQLNKTFTKVEKNMSSIGTIQYQVDTLRYTISNLKTKLYYRDSKQRAEIHDQFILIVGGTLEVEFTFDWDVRGGSTPKSGNGSAYVITDQTTFSKKVSVNDKGFYIFTLVECYPVIVTKEAVLTRFASTNTSQDDITAIKKMLNDLPNNQSVKQKLMVSTNANYKQFLTESLYDQSYEPIEDEAYVWEDPFSGKGKLVVNFTNKAAQVKLLPDGVTMTYNSTLKDFAGWKCGNYSAPSKPQNKSIYGGIQEFISHTILENTVRLARDKGFFNTKLNRMNWESRFNQFFAGDLYEVIPKIGETFAAGTPVQGMCTAEKDTYAYKTGIGSIDVVMNYKCNLTISQTEVARFGLVLDTSVEGRANNTHLNFHVVHNAVSNITYENVGQYIVQNKVLAQTMINHSLNRLLQHRTFGSGWRLYTRDYPQFAVYNQYVFIYDSSHVNSQQLQDN